MCNSERAYGIVGRDILLPAIFPALERLKRNQRRPVGLTDALERLRQDGHTVYGYVFDASRQDIGALVDQAADLIGISGISFDGKGSRRENREQAPRLAISEASPGIYPLLQWQEEACSNRSGKAPGAR